MNALRLLAERLGRHTLAYGANGVIAFAAGIASLAVLTRYLSIDEFAQLALLLLFSAALTVLYCLPVLQGGFSWVFGSTGEEDAEDVDDPAASATTKRRALSTALFLLAVVAAAGTLAISVVADPLGELLIGAGVGSRSVVLASVAGAFGAVWRLVSNVPRFERRPRAYVGLSTLRPALVLGISIPLVVAGEGVDGALMGTALGTALAVVAGLAATRDNYALAIDRAHVSPILSRGRLFVPILLAFWAIHNLDLYVVSLAASAREVAEYRVGSRIGAGMSYFVSAFLMAWSPLLRGPLGEAVGRERGRPAAAAAIFTYFLAACAWLALALFVAADLLVRIAPPAYAQAAPLIPLVALAFVVYGIYVFCYRGASFPGKRRLYVALTVSVAVASVAGALGLVSLIGPAGAPLAQVAAFLAATGVLLGYGQRNAQRIPFERGRLATIVAVVVAGLGVSVAARGLPDALAAATDLAVLAFVPVLLVRAGAVPGDHLRTLAHALGLSRRTRREGSSAWLLAELTYVDDEQRTVLEHAARAPQSPTGLAAALHMREPEAIGALVTALRALAGVDTQGSGDEVVGRYLLAVEPVAEHDAHARRICQAGVDPLELERLERLMRRLRALSRSAWEQVGEGVATRAGADAESAGSARR